jgi:O-antigen ligase
VIGSVTAELSPSKLTSVGTTAHRTSGYEAIRPLTWSRPAFGQGYGSYNADLLRILDSQILMTTIETGLIGLVCYLGMMVTTLATARALFRRQFTERAWLALGLGLGAVAFLTSSFLYDTMSFPHGPYIFLTFAAFVSIMYVDRGRGRPAANESTRSG